MKVGQISQWFVWFGLAARKVSNGDIACRYWWRLEKHQLDWMAVCVLRILRHAAPELYRGFYVLPETDLLLLMIDFFWAWCWLWERHRKLQLHVLPCFRSWRFIIVFSSLSAEMALCSSYFLRVVVRQSFFEITEIILPDTGGPVKLVSGNSIPLFVISLLCTLRISRFSCTATATTNFGSILSWINPRKTSTKMFFFKVLPKLLMIFLWSSLVELANEDSMSASRIFHMTASCAVPEAIVKAHFSFDVPECK